MGTKSDLVEDCSLCLYKGAFWGPTFQWQAVAAFLEPAWKQHSMDKLGFEVVNSDETDASTRLKVVPDCELDGNNNMARSASTKPHSAHLCRIYNNEAIVHSTENLKREQYQISNRLSSARYPYNSP